MNEKKPDLVHWAQICLSSSLAIGAIRSTLEYNRLSQQASQIGGGWFIHTVTLFTFLSMGILIYLLGKRKNWARWLYVGLFVLGAPFSISPLMQSLTHEPISGMLGLVQVVAQIGAGVMLFLPAARAWYKSDQKQAAQ